MPFDDCMLTRYIKFVQILVENRYGHTRSYILRTYEYIKLPATTRQVDLVMSVFPYVRLSDRHTIRP